MTKAIPVIVFSLLTLVACSSAPEPAAEKTNATPPPAAPAPVPDHTSLFADAGQVSTKVVPDHLLDMKSMPGGSLSEYDVKGVKYQEFIIDTDNAQQAAFLMLDMKAEMKDPQYIPWMGGYAGDYNGKPLYCFAKLHYLAGVVGLPEAKADPLGRQLAAQLH